MSAASIPAGMPKSARVAARVELRSIRLVEARLEVSSKPFDGEAELDVQVKTGFERRGDDLLVLVGVWLRLLPVDAPGAEPDEDAEPLLSVIAEHVATYLLHEAFDADDEELDAFVEQSGVLGVWPFARETIQTLAGKAGFAEVTLPIRKTMLDGPSVATGGANKAPAKRAPAKKSAAKKAAVKKPPVTRAAAERVPSKNSSGKTRAPHRPSS